MINLAAKKGNLIRVASRQPEYIENLKRSLDEVADNLPSVKNIHVIGSSKKDKVFKA